MRGFICGVFVFLFAIPAQAQLVTGKYIGNSTDNRDIENLGFDPDVVLIRRGTTAGICPASLSSSVPLASDTMGADKSKLLSLSDQALLSDYIQALQAGGFQVGTSSDVNCSPDTYHFGAFADDATNLETGSYVGTGGIPDRNISTNIDPDAVIVMPDLTMASAWRNENMPANTAYDFAGLGVVNSLKSVGSSQFTVAVSFNLPATTYHYLAFANSSKFITGSYAGDDGTNRTITTTNVNPEMVIVSNNAGRNNVIRTASMAANTCYTFGGAETTDGIKSFGTGSFVVDASTATNSSAATYYWLAFEGDPPTAVRLESFSATSYEKGTFIRWRSGFEVENLGYHVYRDIDGKKERITRSLIAGSSLFVGPQTKLHNGRSYSYWDAHPETNGRVRYWLEAVDLSGKQEWLESVEPVASSEKAPHWAGAPLLDQMGNKEQKAAPEFLQGKNRISAKEITQLYGQRTTLISSDTLYSQYDKLNPTVDTPFTQENTQAFCTGGAITDAHEKQWELAATESIKIGIEKTGWYRVDIGEFGWDFKKARLYVDGDEVPIWIDENAIEFWAVGIDSSSTGVRTYWLGQGNKNGARVQKDNSLLEGTPENPTTYVHTTELKERTIYLAAIKNGDEDNFFGAIISKNTVDQFLEVTDFDANETDYALLEVGIQGFTKGQGHEVHVSLNGVDVGIIDVAVQQKAKGNFSVPHKLLQQGTNVVQLTLQGPDNEKSLVDYIRFTYKRFFKAIDDELRFVGQAGQSIKITGFEDPNIKVIDITNQKILQAKTEKEGNTHSVSFNIAGNKDEERVFLAVSNKAKKSSVFVEKNKPSTLNSMDHSGQVVIIAHKNFMDAATKLKQYRQGQGYIVELVDVQDIYDEFSFGQKDPWALRCFLNWASREWARGLSDVILFGDASFDRRNWLGFGDFDFVPTQLINGTFLETASDDWFGDLDDDGYSDINFGRLPARTLADAQKLVEKIINYEASSNIGRWIKDVLFVNDPEFEKDGGQLGAIVPQPWEKKEILLSGSTQQELFSDLNKGQAVVNYFGHGSVEVWSSAGLFSKDNAEALENGTKLPFVMSMTCLNGFFHDIYTESMAEALINAENGGAIAVLGSSTLKYPQVQKKFNEDLLKELFSGNSKTLGESIYKVKRQSPKTKGLQQTWILFGDPLVQIKGIHENNLSENEGFLDMLSGCSGCNVGVDTDGILLLLALSLFIFLRRRK